MAGMYQWKHGHKGLGIYWFQQSRDKTRLSQIAHKLFDNIGKAFSDDSFKVLLFCIYSNLHPIYDLPH
jgi:nuclear pore complex protein Nup85